jgi:GT2 family glycosyltransferase
MSDQGVGVSVVIPSYNRARHLPNAIASVLAQRHQNLEIIVVDDGSQDETREVVTSFGDLVHYVYQRNGGVGSARNTGIRHATQEFVAFLDSDDRWAEGKLSMQLAVFDAHPEVGMVFSDFVIEKPSGEIQTRGAARWVGHSLAFPMMRRGQLRRPPAAAGQDWPADSVEYWSGPMYRQLLDELPVLTSSVMVRRAVLDASTFYAEHVVLFEDWEFFARLARKAPVAYLAAATTVNNGHREPGRVSHCSRAARAAAYVSLLERVWLADREFVRDHEGAVRSARGRALLALAREALLEGRRADAAAALNQWQGLGVHERSAWAQVYGMCTRVAAGPPVLRQLLRARALGQYLLGAGQRTHGSVNPAA